MRDYQPKTSPYVMKRSVYLRMLALVRDYPRMRQDYEAALASGGGGDPTAERALRVERLGTDLRAVHAALSQIPQEYHEGVLDNIIFRVPLVRIEGASEKTWSRWKSRFLWELALQQHLIGPDGE